MFGDKETVRAGGAGEEQRLVEGQLWESPLDAVGRRRLRRAGEARGRPRGALVDAVGALRRAGRRAAAAARGVEDAEKGEREEARHGVEEGLLHGGRVGARVRLRLGPGRGGGG